MTPHKVWLYNQADFVRANSLLFSIDWLQVLPSSDPNASWIIFKELFLRIMDCTIPSKLTFPSNKSSLPWINHSYLKRVKIRNSLFIFAKKVGSPRLWAEYIAYRNETLAYLRQLKSKFFQSLSTYLLRHSGLLLNVFVLNLFLSPP